MKDGEFSVIFVRNGSVAIDLFDNISISFMKKDHSRSVLNVIMQDLTCHIIK